MAPQLRRKASILQAVQHTQGYGLAWLSLPRPGAAPAPEHGARSTKHAGACGLDGNCHLLPGTDPGQCHRCVNTYTYLGVTRLAKYK